MHLQHFIQALDRFESHMYSMGASQSASDMLKLLGVQIVYPEAPNEPARILSKHADLLSAYDYHDISSVIVALRFFEILAVRAGLVSRVPSSSPLVTLYLSPMAKAGDKLPVRDSS